MDNKIIKRKDMMGNNFAKGHKELLHYFKKGNIPHNKLPEGTPTWYFRNKQKWIESRKKYKLENPEKIKESQHRAAKKDYDLKRNIVDSFKKRPCMDCKKEFPSCVMDLDHVRGKKVKSIGANLKSFSMENLLLELEKCDVVCSNCHRIRTWSQTHNGILTSEV